MSAKRQTIAKAHYETLAGFRYALRQFLRFSEEAAHDAGMTPQQHQAMLAIAGTIGRESITIGELAEHLQIKHQSAVGLANRMGSKGWLEKKHSPTDKRQVLISLTAVGRRVLEDLTAAHKAEIARISPTLKKILNNLDNNNNS